MTNSEIKKYFEEATIDYAHGVESVLKAGEVVKGVLNSLEENGKLKAEIERIKNESHRRSDMLLQEIERLESELEQSVRLPLTNADKIRSMSGKELAEFLTRITNDAQLNVGAKCNYQWDEWLQNEVEK